MAAVGRSANKKSRGVGRPKGSEKGVTRMRILAAARVAFARSGYAATTTHS